MESALFKDETYDSHIVQHLRINREEVFNLYLNIFPDMNTDFRARVSNETRQLDPEMSGQSSQGIAGGGPPFREIERNTLRSGSSGVVPLETGVNFQLGYGSFTPNLRQGGDLSEVYLGSPPGSSLGNQEQQTLEYGYGTAWVQDYMSRGGGAISRRRRLDTLVEMSEESVTPAMHGTQISSQPPSNNFNEFMRHVPSSTPSGAASMQQVAEDGGGVGASDMHLDHTAHIGTRWRGGRARRLSFYGDQGHFLPDFDVNGGMHERENGDLGFSGQNVEDYNLREVEQEFSEMFYRAQNLLDNQAPNIANISSFDPIGTPTSYTDTPHPHAQNRTSHSQAHTQSHPQDHTSQNHGRRQLNSGREHQGGSQGGGGGSGIGLSGRGGGGGGGDGDDGDDNGGSGDDRSGHGDNGHRPNDRPQRDHQQGGQNDNQEILMMLGRMMRESEVRTVRMMEMIQDQNRALQQQMAQAPRVINDVLNNFNRTYQQWSHIKLVGIDPFDPDRESGRGRNGERTENDVRIFLQKILPTLLQENYAEVTRIRTLIFYTRGSARDYLSGYPQDGSVPLNTFINDLDYYFQRRESPHTLMAQLQKASRKPGQNLIQYNLSLK